MAETSETVIAGCRARLHRPVMPAGTAPAGAHQSEQVLWGRTYAAVTLRDLVAGERRDIQQAVS